MPTPPIAGSLSRRPLAPSPAAHSDTPGGLWWLWWLVVLAAAVLGRPLLPIDETRYAAVAWEMWRDQHGLYPTLDGTFYAHKPPLLFWLTLLGWAVVGVADWVPLAIVAAMGMGAVVATARLNARLWPDQPLAVRWVPVTFGLALIWLLFAPAWYFDVPNALWCVLGFHGVLDLAQRRWGRGLAVLGLACTAGVFTKGPMVLLTVGAAAAVAPFWGPRWAGWRRPPILVAVLATAASMAVALGLYAGWLAVADAHAEGTVWREVLGAQAVDRLSDDADHAAPLWWYLPQLAWMLWPGWVVALALCRAPAPHDRGRAHWDDGGTQLVALSGVVLLAVLSVAAGKRAHYLMGWIPLGAAWLAQALTRADLARPVGLGWRALAALPALAAGAALAVAGGRYGPLAVYPWAGPALQAVGVGLGLWGAVMLWPARAAARWVQRLAAGGIVLMLLHVAVPRAMAPAFDVRDIATRVGAAMRAGHPIAWTDGRFHGVLSFYGRLPRPPAVVAPAEVAAWRAHHPDGWVLIRVRPAPVGGDCVPYRSAWLCVLGPTAP